MSLKTAITLGLSSCPNDTFIFHGLLHGLSSPDFNERFNINTHMADVEELNQLAQKGTLEISKVSLGVIPHISDKYRILNCGGALGWGVGPLLVSKKHLSESVWQSATIAIPGKFTTANLLLDLHGGFNGPRYEMLFSDIIPAVAAGEVDMGLIIHEGRFTYSKFNLHKVLDLGEWWEDKYKCPLPLGLIVARRDLDVDLAREMEQTIAKSLNYAWQNPEASRPYIRAHAQEMDENVIDSHIRTFVTKYSENLAEDGRAAIKMILQAAKNEDLEEDLFL